MGTAIHAGWFWQRRPMDRQGQSGRWDCPRIFSALIPIDLQTRCRMFCYARRDLRKVVGFVDRSGRLFVIGKCRDRSCGEFGFGRAQQPPQRPRLQQPRNARSEKKRCECETEQPDHSGPRRDRKRDPGCDQKSYADHHTAHSRPVKVDLLFCEICVTGTPRRQCSRYAAHIRPAPAAKLRPIRILHPALRTKHKLSHPANPTFISQPKFHKEKRLSYES
jgi:hypothetical protein